MDKRPERQSRFPATTAGLKPIPRVSAVEASFDGLNRLWRTGEGGLEWRCLFSLPPWMSAWWRHRHGGGSPWLRVFRDRHGLLGVAPLRVRGANAWLVGSDDVCDHLDVAVRPGHAASFTAALLERLRAEGIAALHAEPVRADSAIAQGLAAVTPFWGDAIEKKAAAQTREVDLPSDWTAYLQALSGKERHEIRRKLRRLNAAGRVRYRRQETVAGLSQAMDRFIALFRANRPDKAAFMTPSMAAFFRDLADETAKAGLLRLYFLDIEGVPAAGVFCCDHQGVRHLYNNGYDDRFRHLSVGLLAKLHSLQEAIGASCGRYDFLKGDELYKARLGGLPHPLFRFRVDLSVRGA